MKKALSILLVLLVILSLGACGGKSGGTKATVSAGAGPAVTADGVTFNFKPKGTPAKIFLAGSMNGWKPDDPKYALEDLDGDGTWSLTTKIAPGKYQYKFVVDGTWTTDKANPKSTGDGFGGKNSLVEVQ